MQEQEVMYEIRAVGERRIKEMEEINRGSL